jgi:hypothetical protein
MTLRDFGLFLVLFFASGCVIAAFGWACKSLGL